MRYNISRIYGTIIAFPIAVIAWISSIFALELNFIFDFLISAVAFIAFYFPTQRLTSRKYLNEIGLTRRDYHFVNSQLNNAQDKIRRILKSFVNVRSIKDFRQVNEIYRLSRAIYFAVKQQPRMFFKVESFFYSHIDNALNLIEAYTRLAKSPKKSKEEKQKLAQTRITLDEVKRTLVADLKRINEEDYSQLDIEMELNKIEQKRHK
ncbi:5-bromo-4-chloroindolyl phosphate hydrolysis family protein [Staphylococcus cohnii]|uniref:5-bromo-4-chloroindolyl phosphate hydrolysis family protein n=2 Tax=Staphylococcus cohnii TaxID=29382 RepID=A0ABT6J3N8_9STAP|nr:5-bromo-4-chloroindolyl phosphate hydrolysis family protein [Staphylococcus cohnii]TGP60470.1 5-bromo-4-chloroindolyl phosphate hydrolase [bacterium M00.F.Ca.ET.229.01.1.1]TGS37228.1 5-bromo-4-chloroindolyl phosphate hydrolase [bacterium M00.F.Ca.ET.180.01.1.1]AYX89808.1 5-bromo-4-chloroindolyl phosphate hydrolase [Staphylococcus cohnii]KKI62835.1 5-bromo-4-chloroindolyl phosphate hydrolysis protein [Staphylococcus cohnii subsp. cohnii]MCI2941948.1 5-bromo-4-chloroindolyl phosphate hydrolys